MKKINLPFRSLVLPALVFMGLLGCSKQVEKPKITISEYSVQATTSKGVVEKIMNESDYKKMHEIALAVESSRAISCILVSDECNILGQILNKIVQSTNEGLPNEAANVAIYKLINQLDEEFRKGNEKLAGEWKEYNAAEVNSK